MDPNWLTALVALSSLFVVLTSALFGFFFKISKELSEHKTDVADYKAHVAEFYSKKGELIELSERIERQMNIGFNRIYDILNKKRDTK